jgi:hypothetical protein
MFNHTHANWQPFSAASNQNIEWLESDGGFFFLLTEGSLFFCNFFFGKDGADWFENRVDART